MCRIKSYFSIIIIGNHENRTFNCRLVPNIIGILTIKVGSCVEWETVPGLLNHIHYYNSGHNLVLTTKSSLYVPVGVYLSFQFSKKNKTKPDHVEFYKSIKSWTSNTQRMKKLGAFRTDIQNSEKGGRQAEEDEGEEGSE